MTRWPVTLQRCFRLALSVLALLVTGKPAWPHDIPNQRVDRSIQATIRPGKLQIDYEVSLTELTLTQDLRALVGSLPGGERSQWLARYGEVTGPLNAKGFLIQCEGLPVVLTVRNFDLVVEEHPRYTFHLEAPLPVAGRLVIHDTNYASSEGTSRLALRGRDGVTVESDELPTEVEEIGTRPVWQLSDEEERRTRKVEATFHGPADFVSVEAESKADDTSGLSEPRRVQKPPGQDGTSRPPHESSGDGLSRLLDGGSGASWLAVLLIAAVLGAVHAIQPGHGKTLVTAIALEPGASWYQPALLGLVTTLAHTGSVLLIAAILWWTGATQVAGLHRGLTRLSGFAIAAGGFYRLGRYLGGWGDHPEGGSVQPAVLSTGGLVGLGVAGGMVPCWDAVGLVVLSAALGRLGAGVLLVIAFGLGMAAVLGAVALIAARLKAQMLLSSRARNWEGLLTLASGVILATIGLVFFSN